MDCFELPDGHTAHHFGNHDEVLSIDSGMIAIVDETNVDAFLAANAPAIRGLDTTAAPQYLAHGNGILCDTGGDGALAFTAFIHQHAVYAVDIYCDDADSAHDRWIPAGLIPTPSGTLLIADPGLLAQYTPDPFEPPVAALRAWTVLALPGPGWIAVHIAKHHGAVEGHNIVVRANWLPSNPPQSRGSAGVDAAVGCRLTA